MSERAGQINVHTFNRREIVIVLSRKIKQGEKKDKNTEVKEKYFR